ncbi:MAG: T9SS type A sorting domain-containing protein [Candidatus Kapabacteria bacterium]|nr:T9SS type A sorting domain-containing protein [Candidatus Kapabacteria bacterium]
MGSRVKYIAFSFVMICIQNITGQTLEITPLYNTIGVKVTNISSADSCIIEYKQSQADNWLLGYQPDKILLNNTEEFRGSIFGLIENMMYQIRVTVYSGSNPKTLAVAQTKTLLSPDFNQTGIMKWVSPSGTGNYTQSNPCNLSTLFSSGQVVCGTIIIVKDGIYNTSGLQLTLNNHCTEGNSILLIAERGASPVFDAGTTITSSWTAHATIPNLYFTPTPPGTSHSNICILDNKALYPYPSLKANVLLGNYNLSDLNFGHDGFVRDEDTIWIKTNTGINPNATIVKVSNAFRFLTVYGNNKNAYLKIKGIEFRYYGKPMLNSPDNSNDSYAATVFDLRNVHHIYFDSCRFIFNTNHILFTNQCNNLTIQNCLFKHNAGKWSHAMIKKSNDFVNTIVATVSSSRARGVETPGVFVHESKSVVFRNNIFDGVNSGIESYFDIGLKEEIDIHDNVFIDNFDAIECDGLWSNIRVWNNEIIRPMAGISAAPPLIGPRYFYRNVLYGMTGRRNEQDDPYFIGCNPLSNNYMGQGIGIKTNSGYIGNISVGNLYFFNNTFHASDTLGFILTSWKAEWRKAIFMNNSYSHTNSFPFFYFDLAHNAINGDFQITSAHDNYFSFNINSPIVKVKHIHGQFNCSEINNISNLENTLANISGSPNISILNPIQVNPLFVSSVTGNFELTAASPLIDAGNNIQGFYDYNGIKPDIGAKESNFTSTIVGTYPVEKQIIVYPNPSGGIFTVKLIEKNELVTINVFNYLGQKIYSISEIGQNFLINIENQLDGVFFIEIERNSGSTVKKIIKISF